MNRFAFYVLLPVLLLPGVVVAVWDEFSVVIDNKYMLVKTNSIDVFILRRNENQHDIVLGSPIVMPADYAGLGPLAELYWDDNYLVAKHFGRKPRNLSKNDNIQLVDKANTFWFIINRKNNDLVGPLEADSYKGWRKALGLPDDIPFLDVRQIYRYSLKTYLDQPEASQRIKESLVLAPVYGLVALLVLLVPSGLLVLPFYMTHRSPRTRRRLWRYWFGGMVVSVVGVMVAVILNSRFFWF